MASSTLYTSTYVYQFQQMYEYWTQEMNIYNCFRLYIIYKLHLKTIFDNSKILSNKQLLISLKPDYKEIYLITIQPDDDLLLGSYKKHYNFQLIYSSVLNISLTQREY